MIPVLFALLVAAAAVYLTAVAARRRRWLEAGISAAAAVLLSYLAFLATLDGIPLWTALLAAWPVLGLACAAAYSLIRAHEKAVTGESAR